MSSIEVLAPGALTTIQDWPGRIGLWHVGVPPSGPMDERSFRGGNRLLGNPQGAAGLEVTLSGPQLRFEAAALVAVTGAPLAVWLDDSPMPQWAPFAVTAGAVLSLGAIRGLGLRAYMLVRGGLGGPRTMGSRAVMALAYLGGRALRTGDRLAIGDGPAGPIPLSGAKAVTDVLALGETHCLRVTLGPQGAPDFLTPAGLDELLGASWRVDHRSDRSGIRLVGPRPQFSRSDGGEAGLHPSNILDSAYSVGTVMLAGDEAVIVGPDGPSLGGFAAFCQVVRADRWRLGQLRAGDKVTLEAVDADRAADLHARAESRIAGVRPHAATRSAAGSPSGALDRPREGAHGPIAFRAAGECAIVAELGEARIDLRSRVRVHALGDALLAEGLTGVSEITAGVRSLHVQYVPEETSAASVVDALAQLEAQLPAPERHPIAGRVVRLPLAWRQRDVMRAVERYQSSVRPDAPWCPDNIDFIRRINGLPDEAAVRATVFDASYLVIGLGDVYLGAPVAVPLDPRHRLVTTKYTPARTWTPANAVGIGGAFLCVYGIEGPGGYQLVGRTAPIWHQDEDPPWRLRHFDQLRFETVSEDELADIRAASEAGEWRPPVEPAEFSLTEHELLLARNATEIADFTARREAAFAVERAAWVAAEQTAGVAA